jgi:hypothetical protein
MLFLLQQSGFRRHEYREPAWQAGGLGAARRALTLTQIAVWRAQPPALRLPAYSARLSARTPAAKRGAESGAGRRAQAAQARTRCRCARG